LKPSSLSNEEIISAINNIIDHCLTPNSLHNSIDNNKDDKTNSNNTKLYTYLTMVSKSFTS